MPILLNHRSQFLSELGATPEEITELLAYNQNNFNSTNLPLNSTFPLASEPHIIAWKRYHAQAKDVGTFTALRSALVQLQFPIRAGISETENYRATTRKGNSADGMPEATGLELEKPESLELIIHPTLAGEIPILIAGCRADFIALVQALTKRNEPVSIPDSMGATAVGGFNNWERISHYRQEWETQQEQPVTETKWKAEFQRLIPQKHLYQDFFIILSQGNYSAVCAAELGLDEAEWLRLCLTIRLEHECCHYFTKRVFGSMRNNMLDELIADYQGIIAANDKLYRADWFLRFVGLEAFPNYRQGGRLENYCGNPPLSSGAFRILQVLLKQAAENLEEFNISHIEELKTVENQARLIMILTSCTLEDLAVEKGTILEEVWQSHTI
ncbi:MULTISPECIES: DUF7005 family protein [unclassified Nostoc]|uniref:DUF7005 family protein n=1 Tax=unclassified Nostoc TaxID=2593658 RepID=UPI002AD2D651|nr:hypothetical protein [Nostoc sp. DedQUE03]MDZ7974995.1 hypothetical protein [Nostoc sp. DedQUE03]MDZ8046630.1 hypothetical protein [Nostoc sp. DedQUE02]